MALKLAGPRIGARRRRPVLLGLLVTLGVVLVAFGLLYATALASAGRELPRGTTVAGVAVGGMRPAAAEAALTAALGPRAEAPLAVRADQDSASLSPRAAGLSLDVPATVRAAARRSWAPAELVRGLVGRRSVAPVVRVDEAALTAAVARLADQLDRPVREGDVVFEGGRPVAVEPRAGRVLDRAATAARVRAAFLGPAGPFDLPVVRQEPTVPSAEVHRALTEVAEPAVAAPVTVAVADRVFEVTPQVLGGVLDLRPDGQGRLALQVDEARLRAAVAPQLAALERPPTDAGFRVVNGAVEVVPAQPGVTVPAGALAQAVLAQLGAPPPRRASVTPVPAVPAFTTEAAQQLGVKEVVSTFTTYYPADFQPRLVNIHRAADLINGSLLKPGDTWSLNQRVGERTAANGFAQGYIISNGRLAVDYGGGVSQVATTMYNAAFFAGLTDVEHNPHSFYISRYPEGREATVAWGVLDLRFRNDTPYGVLITTSYTNSSITATMWSTKIYQVEATKSARYDITPFTTIYDPRPAGTTVGSCVPQDGVEGFRVDVGRRIFRDGQLVKSEQQTVRYHPEDRVLCGMSAPPPPPPPSPAPAASPART